ncbi:MAG: hypothetical protein RSE07_04365 [Oscillospiraceae bacterium]
MPTNTMTISRERELKPPNKYDIRDTKTVLKDFYITTDIPHFDTLVQLNEWKHQQIKSKLFKGS